VRNHDETLETVKGIAMRVVQDLGLTLDRVELSRNPRTAVVRIYVDKEGGVGIEDCAAVSREVGAILDVEDPIETGYVLEVSSPGLDRPLRTREDFEKYSGRRIRLHARSSVEGRHEFRGTLAGAADDGIRVRDEGLGREVRIPFDQIAKARLDEELLPRAKRP